MTNFGGGAYAHGEPRRMIEVTTPAPVVVNFHENLRTAVVSVIWLTVLTGCVFPIVLFGLGRLLYPGQSGGSLVTRDGVVVGSLLIGQNFTRAEYFHPRPSAVDHLVGIGYSFRFQIPKR